MSDLKPCPFCNGKPTENCYSPKGGTTYYEDFWVSCIDCGATTSAHRVHKKAMKAWNTRAGEDDE